MEQYILSILSNTIKENVSWFKGTTGIKNSTQRATFKQDSTLIYLINVKGLYLSAPSICYYVEAPYNATRICFVFCAFK